MSTLLKRNLKDLLYLIFLAFSFTLLLISWLTKSKWPYYLFFALLVLIPGLRGDVGQDTFSYGTYFSSIHGIDSVVILLAQLEPVLTFLMYVVKKITGSYTVFLLLVSFIQGVLIWNISRKIEHKYLFLALYCSLFLIEYHFNVIRASLGILLFTNALLYAKVRVRLSALLVLLALLTHISAAIFIPVWLFRVKMKPLTFALTCSIIAVFFFVIWFVIGDMLLHKLEFYGLTKVPNVEFPLLSTVLIFIIFLGVAFLSKVTYTFLASVAIFSIALFLSATFDIMYRIFFISFFLVLVLAFERSSFSIKKVKFKPIIISLLVVNLWFSVGNLNYVLNEPYLRNSEDKVRQDFTFVPYELWYKSEYR